MFPFKRKLSLKERLFPKIQKSSSSLVIWLHAVSMGEVRSAASLIYALQKKHPDASFYLSVVTQTGHQESHALLENVTIFYLPLDFRFSMKRAIEAINPTYFLMVEGDYWFNLLTLLKEKGIPAVLVSGKISERSTKRFGYFNFFAKRLFGLISRYLLQTTEYSERFQELGVDPERIDIIGNLKESFLPQKIETLQAQELKKRFLIQDTDRVIVVGSTHDQEELWIFEALSDLKDLKFLFVPRHLERFSSVHKQLEERLGSISTYSNPSSKPSRALLLDEMGLLCASFHLATLAVIGGSFVSFVGGHNVLEPVLRHVPVLFGPHTFSQKSLVSKVLEYGAGKQIDLFHLKEAVDRILQDSHMLESMKKGCGFIQNEAGLPLEKTLQLLAKHFFI